MHDLPAKAIYSLATVSKIILGSLQIVNRIFVVKVCPQVRN